MSAIKANYEFHGWLTFVLTEIVSSFKMYIFFSFSVYLPDFLAMFSAITNTIAQMNVQANLKCKSEESKPPKGPQLSSVVENLNL